MSMSEVKFVNRTLLSYISCFHWVSNTRKGLYRYINIRLLKHSPTVVTSSIMFGCEYVNVFIALVGENRPTLL